MTNMRAAYGSLNGGDPPHVDQAGDMLALLGVAVLFGCLFVLVYNMVGGAKPRPKHQPQ